MKVIFSAHVHQIHNLHILNKLIIVNDIRNNLYIEFTGSNENEQNNVHVDLKLAILEAWIFAEPPVEERYD